MHSSCASEVYTMIAYGFSVIRVSSVYSDLYIILNFFVSLCFFCFGSVVNGIAMSRQCTFITL